MKYFSGQLIEEALSLLKSYNAFFGTTFLVLKKARVPIGSRTYLSLDAENKIFLDTHYRVHPKSKYFFRVFRPTHKAKDWVNPDYASTGLQSINTRTFPDALLHEKYESTWGWTIDYLEHLRQRLPHARDRIPLFHLAVWIYRERAFKESYTGIDIVNEFISEFSITEDEIETLFDIDMASGMVGDESFQEHRVQWTTILASRTTPKDVPTDSSGTLNHLEVYAVGPVHKLIFQPSERLNLVTGDNGLGKTFLLDLSWWALTGDWVDMPATPTEVSPSGPPYIEFAVGGTDSRTVPAHYEASTGTWLVETERRGLSGLAVYARLDGSFAVWDPASRLMVGTTDSVPKPSLKFTRDEIWYGKERELEGLIRDWLTWQFRNDFHSVNLTFQAVLKRILPPDLSQLVAGDPVRIPHYPREIPTLRHPYGDVPVLFESAGIRRIIALAYLVVWAWEEHKIRARNQRRPEERQMIVLIDEAEAHLHPKWQRVILPALLGISSDLHEELSVQWVIASHSPLVMASGESTWNEDSDALFHLEMDAEGRASFEQIPFEPRGTIDSWLSSEVFEIAQPGSWEREAAIEAAVELQQQEHPTTEDVQEITDQLRTHLAAEDPFWVRWIFFAQNHGIAL